MDTHPEQRDDEVFVGNTAADGSRNPKLPVFDLTTARMGNQAYDVWGKEKLPTDYMRPLFIGRSEMHIYDDRYNQAMKAARRMVN